MSNKTERLKKLWHAKKHELDLTQVKLARLLEMSQPTVSQYLNGVIPLNTDAVLQFAQVLQVDPAEIDPDIKLRWLTTVKLKVLNVHDTYIDAPTQYAGCLAFRVDAAVAKEHSPALSTGDTLIVKRDLAAIPKERTCLFLRDSETVIGRVVSITSENFTVRNLKDAERIIPVEGTEIFQVMQLMRNL